MSCGHVVLADSHSSMLEGMRRMTDRMAESVIMVADEFSLIQAIHRTKLNLVIADLSFRDSGAENVARLKQLQPSVKVIVVSICDDEAAVTEAADAGTESFVLRRHAVVDLIPAIDKVCQCRWHASTGDYSDKDRDWR